MTSYEIEEKQARARTIKWITLGIVVLLIIVVTGLIGCPSYNVYTQKKEGEAVLAHAQSSREVAVAEARAKMESAALLAQADTIRAHGVARANEIIGKSLKDNEEYLHWLWIDNIEKNPQAVFYIPTENGLPKFVLPLDKPKPSE
jgi:predicted aminopeptidase